MVARSRSCCIHKWPSSFEAGGNQVCTRVSKLLWMELDRCFPTKRKPLHCRGFLKFSERLFPYQLPHTAAFHQTQDQPVFWVPWTDQSNIKPTEKNTPASSKVNLQSLMTSLEIDKSLYLSWQLYQRPYHYFPVNLQSNYCAYKLWRKNTANHIASWEQAVSFVCSIAAFFCFFVHA